MQDNLTAILEKAKADIAATNEKKQIEDVRIKYLGKKSEISNMLKSLGKLSKEEKKSMGKSINSIKHEIEKLISDKKAEIDELEKAAKFRLEKIDVTEPSKRIRRGVRHPITLVIEEISEIFTSMGYSIAEGPQVESVFNVFDGLNSPIDHPSRDKTDTFYVSEDTVLRPHTSSVQIRTLLKEKPPIKIIAPGRCFRCDTPDATHSPMFHQIEGLVVDEGITMADLKGTLDFMAKKIFGDKTRIKLRPHHFPFTEPSAEMDVSCFSCGGSGCRICKNSGWIEILGCGMVHPNVLSVGNIDNEKYSAFAFGMGVERIAMLKYGIEDIRLFYENDVRFIEQFR